MGVFALLYGSFLCIKEKDRLCMERGISIFLRIGFLFAIAIPSFYIAFMHAAFPEIVAENIGWPESPRFQFEIAGCNFAIAVAAVFAARKNAAMDFKIATVLIMSIFLFWAAAGHIADIFINRNFASGNVGSILYTDIIFPIVFTVLLAIQYAQHK